MDLKDRFNFVDFLEERLEQEKKMIAKQKKMQKEKYRLLDEIRQNLVEKLTGDGACGLVENESHCHPKSNLFASCDPVNTRHVDSFLYPDDDAVDELCATGKLSRNYCKNCLSTDIEPINFISHSMSEEQTRWIFNSLPDLTGKRVLDIGSRLGVVLYTGYLFSNASRLVGIELNESFVKIQNELVSKYKWNDRIQIICGDIMNHADTIAQSDVVVMNNVFDAFVPQEQLFKIWEFIFASFQKMKKGSYIVTYPSLDESLEHAQVPNDTKRTWTSHITPLPLDLQHLTPHIAEEVEGMAIYLKN
eukprot:TRINITY_DN4577_c0_g1_i1.p1 TRINITY_DN4577_c0_g1~~TRINITY_DN4577_c0_g1_i1.p1  ORF type:complete len:328 (-),score=67.11 TRINITY_DN4577_c0_g1_i1:68-979(-)